MEARAAFDKALALNPDQLSALEELVNLDLTESRVPAALARVKTQLDKDPKAPLPWLLQAQIHLRQKENAQAQSRPGESHRTGPQAPPALPHRWPGFTWTRNNRGRLSDKLNALVRMTNSLSALMEIGMIHDQLKKYDLARQSYEKLLDANPHYAGALNNLAYLYSEHFNDLDKAYQFAEKSRKSDPIIPTWPTLSNT